MPTAPVDDKGTVLYYEDSGVPEGSNDYITVVLIHGTCFHSAVYRPLIPFAAERNLRLVLLNIRDYPGSTPYSAEDFEDLRGATLEAQERALQTRGLEIAAFVRWFIQTQDTPPIKEDPETKARTGGVSVLAWSGGTSFAVATFAHADKLDEETRRLLDAHLRTFILFDPSVTVVGHARPPGLIALSRNPSAPAEVQAAEFALAVSSYFPPFTLPECVDPPPTYDPPRRALHLASDPVDPRYMPTSSKMTPEALRSLTYAAVWEDSQHLLWAIGYDVYRRNLARALYDCRIIRDQDGSGALEKVWPGMRVHLLWCDMSIGDCLWASAVIHAQYPEAHPEHRRPVEFHRLEGTNHFVHWEEPERFITLLAGIV
ncbi:alpha/beta-hydrolase [Lenzites betulinus]|nr:alpha/beta-hydrolase [Lenzites betulinus]